MTVTPDHPLAQRVLRLLASENGWNMTHRDDQRVVHHSGDDWMTLQLSPDFPCLMVRTRERYFLILLRERRRWWNRLLRRDKWEYDRKDVFFLAFHRIREAVRARMRDASLRTQRHVIPAFRPSK